MTTYDEIAHACFLTPEQTQRYVQYMRTRWGDTEEQKCTDGYAAEWAHRFASGIEFGASDREGQAILSGLKA